MTFDHGGTGATKDTVPKYTALSEIFTRRAPYRLAVLGDDALVIALPMLVVAFATLLVSHSLFLDETDFRVTAGEPIPAMLVSSPSNYKLSPSDRNA
jgi:hypothetical protein